MYTPLVLGVLVSLAVCSVASQPTLSLLKPQGIRFSVPDAPGMSLVAFHYSINTPLQGIMAGQHAKDVTAKTGNEWVLEDTDVVVHPGDTVHYWALQIKDGQGTNLLDQTWVATEPMSTTNTTPKPVTQPKPVTAAPMTAAPVTAAPVTQGPVTQAPIVGGNQQQVVTGSNQNSGAAQETTKANQKVASNQQTTHAPSSSNQHETVPPSTSNQQASTSTSGSGSCGCTGSSIKPPGSEKTCTQFPCLIFEDNFDTLDLDVWEHEITASGGGNWEFQYYNNNRSNSYVRDGKLFIKPTLTVDSLGVGPNGLTRGALDLWGSQPGDICTANMDYGCKRDGTPDHILNPIQSARLRSSRGFNFKYGKVEISAKMPTGDWIWPAIWLLPLRNAYGKWPASGEIDIVEARGNRQYTDDKGQTQAIDNAGSTLHFGSDFWHNKWPKAHGEKQSSSGTYGDSFHKYVLVWDEDHISISIDDTEVVNVTPQSTMWEYGGNDQDNVDNPWAAGNKMAPFDQEFFLILNVAVGGTAFFPDKFNNPTGKPWSDKSDFALRDFWNGRGNWEPTWNLDKNNGEDAAMQVDYIRVWKLK